MENKNNTAVGEENLEGVTGGGSFFEIGAKTCFFTPTGSVRTSEENGQKKLYAQCASNCISFTTCQCHGKDQCVDKWHTIDSKTSELLPVSFGNHKQKKPDNRYNT